MTHRLYILIFLLLCSIPLFSQENWMKQAGNKIGPDNGFQIVTDSCDNIYITGNFTGQAQFGDSIVTANNDDCYVAKYSRNGDLIWLRTFGGKGSQTGNTIALQSNGDIIVAGNFNNELIINDTILKSNWSDIFLIKMNSFGQIQWYKTFGNGQFNDINKIKFDSENNLYAVGRISDTISVDNKLIVSHGQVDGYILKLDYDANLIWFHVIGGIDDDETNNLSLDNHDNVYISGKCSYKVFIDSDSLKTTDFSSSYLAKFSKTGDLLIFKTYGEELLTETWDITNDYEGNLYITGFHCGTIKIDNVTYPSAPEMSYAMFIAKLNDKVELVWFKHYFSTGNSYGHSVNIDSNNSCYLFGTFYQDIKINRKKYKSKDKSGSVILKFNANGDLDTYKIFVGKGSVDFWSGYLSKTSNYLYTTGSFTNCYQFDKLNTFCTESDKDILIMKQDKNLKK